MINSENQTLTKDVVTENSESTDILEASETYFTFWQENDQYALKASIVREVFIKKNIYPVPMVPDYIKGIINLRGNVIPILDLSLMFFNHKIEETITTSIAIVEVSCNEEDVIVGIMIDDVHEVLNVKESEVEHPPDFGANINPDYVNGIVNKESGYIIILNTDYLLDIKKLAEY